MYVSCITQLIERLLKFRSLIPERRQSGCLATVLLPQALLNLRVMQVTTSNSGKFSVWKAARCYRRPE